MAQKPTIQELEKQIAQVKEEMRVNMVDAITKMIGELGELGFPYELIEKKKKQHKGVVATKPCPVCKFQTKPPHDGRSHRYQKKNAPFTAAELKELGLTKVE